MIQIHSIVNSYTPRLINCTKDDDDHLVTTFADVAEWAYLPCHGIRNGTWIAQDWKVVAKLNVTNGRYWHDSDNVVIVQNTQKNVPFLSKDQIPIQNILPVCLKKALDSAVKTVSIMALPKSCVGFSTRLATLLRVHYGSVQRSTQLATRWVVAL